MTECKSLPEREPNCTSLRAGPLFQGGPGADLNAPVTSEFGQWSVADKRKWAPNSRIVQYNDSQTCTSVALGQTAFEIGI